MLPSIVSTWLKTGLVALALGASLTSATPGSASAAPGGKSFHHQSLQVSPGGQLGVQVLHMTDDLRKHFGAAAGVGILVDRVLPDSPAAKAGIKSGDVITHVAGETISHNTDVLAQLSQRKKGDSVTVTVIRNKKKVSLQAKLNGTSALGMYLGSAGAKKGPAGSIDPFGHPFPNHFGDAYGPGRMKIEFGKDFPLQQSTAEMQKKILELEKRLNSLEGKKNKKKSQAPAGPKS